MSKTKDRNESIPKDGKGLFCFSCGKELCRGNSIDMPKIVCPRCGSTYAVYMEDGIFNFLQLTDEDGYRVADDIMIEYHKRFAAEYRMAKLQKMISAQIKKEAFRNAEVCEKK